MKHRSDAYFVVFAWLLLIIVSMGLFSCSKQAEGIKSHTDDEFSREPMETPMTEQEEAMKTPMADSAPPMAMASPAFNGARASASVSFEKKKKSPKKETVRTWKRSSVTANTSRLMIGDNEELPLKAMQVNVLIEGFRARVVVDAYYFNDRDRQYEGNFKLRLPDGASPYFFAFGEMTLTADIDFGSPVFMNRMDALNLGVTAEDIMAARKDSWTAPREAVMAPKEKAARAYKETVRRKVDPALMEWSGPGIFSSRVFPLLAGKLHRIVIGYDVDLTAVGEDLEYRLDLPENIPHGVVDLFIGEFPNVQVETEPETRLAFVRIPGENRGKYYHRYENPQFETIRVRLKNPGTMMLKGADAAGEDYFAVDFQPAPPVAEKEENNGSAVFLVDVSLSSNPDPFNIYLTLLEAILKNNRDAIESFAVLFFNIETFWWKKEFVANTETNVADLLQYAGGLSLEGATDIGAALARAARPDWLKDDVQGRPRDLFLLSDGSPTWGGKDPYAFSGLLNSGRSGALFAYRTGLSGVDANMLNHLARETAGAVFSVVGEAEIEKASTAHRARPWFIEDIRIDGGRDLLLAGRPLAVFPGQRLKLAGRGDPGVQPAIRLTLRRAGDKTILKIPVSNVLPSPLAQRAYGRIAVGQLESFGMASEEISKAYATHFRVPGKTDSLVMLESERDYRRFDIEPEEDAFVVKSTPVKEYIASLLHEIVADLGNPKVSFLSRLEKMEKMPGFRFETPRAFKIALRIIPEDKFNVTARPLVASDHTWGRTPKKIQTMLGTRKLEYDAIHLEAERRLRKSGPVDALKIASSLIENNPGDATLARDIAYSAFNWGFPGHAYHLFRGVAESRPFEPQTYRAMARGLENAGMADLALAWYEVGLIGRWDQRFGEFRRILGLDYLRFLRKIEAGDLETSILDYAGARLKRVAGEFDPGDVDLLVSITWNTDGADVDLHVLEPTGETCDYKNRKTRIGGELTTDVTTGYGPEMYILKNAGPGRYTIKVSYFSSDANRTSARTKASVAVFERWGRKDESITQRTVSLADNKEMHDILTLTVQK